jgi:hypothetical protein
MDTLKQVGMVFALITVFAIFPFALVWLVSFMTAFTLSASAVFGCEFFWFLYCIYTFIALACVGVILDYEEWR